MFKQSFKSILPPLAILLSFFIVSQVHASCSSTSANTWGVATWSGCSASPPGPSDDVIIIHTVTLDQPVAVNQIHLSPGTLNASNFTLTLTANEPILNAGGTFNSNKY